MCWLEQSQTEFKLKTENSKFEYIEVDGSK